MTTATKRARNVDREAPEPEWKAVHRVADRHAGKLAATYVGSLHLLRRDVNREHVLLALERNAPEIAVASFPWEPWARALDRMVTPRLAEVMRQAGEAVGRRTVIRKQEFTLQGIFDLLNPRAQRIAAEIAARLVTRVTAATQWAMRQVIADAQARGVSVREQAFQIREILIEQAGLDAPRGQRLERFRTDLIDRGLGPDVVGQRVAERRDRLILDRARTIARHETMDASVAGQVELWDQAFEAGLLPRTMVMEWITTPDKRLCPICEPMDRQRVPRGQLFRSDHNGKTYKRPPEPHVMCRCALALVDPDEE